MSCWTGSPAGSAGSNYGGGSAGSCSHCWPICRGRIAGRSPSTPGMPRPMACSTCWPGRSGIPTGCARTCATTSWSTSGSPVRCWIDDPARCAAAGVPAGGAFATKPALATAMLTRALDAGVPAGWVAGDEVYGADPDLRAALEVRGVGYVLAIAGNRRLPTVAGPLRADALAAALPRRAWQRLSAGPGAKGQRYYDWAWLELPAPDRAAGPGCWWLLIRRSRRTGELAFYRCYHPTPVRLIQLVAVAGRRWTVEECFQAGKGLAGLDEHQVRRWLPWRRWTLLAMLAHALLVVLAAGEHAAAPPPAGLIPLTCNELQRLLTRLVLEPARRPADPEAWSRWRRRHQYRARISHYGRHAAGLS